MGWLDDAAAWIDDRKKDAEALSSTVAKAAEATVKAAVEPILYIEKTAREWTAALEDIVLKYGNTPYEMLPQLIKDKLKELNVSKEQLTTATQEIITGLEIPGIPEIPVPGDLFGAAKQILSIIRIPGHIFLNWMKITETIYNDNNSLFKELRKYGR